MPKESPKSRIQMEKFVEHIYLDMLLNEILLNKKREELLRKIDHVLDLRDEEQFMHLTNELKKSTCNLDKYRPCKQARPVCMAFLLHKNGRCRARPKDFCPEQAAPAALSVFLILPACGSAPVLSDGHSEIF